MNSSPDVAILLERFGSGGVERVACLVANGLAARGFKVEMAVLEGDGPTRSLLSNEVPVRVLAAGGRARRSQRFKGAGPAIASFLRDRSPRLFHAPGNHTISPAAHAIREAEYIGAFVPKITNPLIGVKTSWWKHPARRLKFRHALRQARAILVLSPSGVEEVARVDRALCSRVRFIHNPYVSQAMLQRSGERRPAMPPVILSVGRLCEQKNQALLLRAVSRLPERNWRVRLCGTGPDEAALQKLSAELGIAERVDFVGFIADPVPEYLAATVLAQSSRWEGLPATVLEAIACGCPIVATASSPGLVHLLHEVGARALITCDDEAGLASALREALDGRLSAVPPEAALPFGIEASLDEHASVFQELLDATRNA